MATEEYADFKESWLPFDDLNILISWDAIKVGVSVYLDVVIYQPRHNRIVDESIKIHKGDFNDWIAYMEEYIHFDVYRDILIHIEQKYNERWINLSWDEVT